MSESGRNFAPGPTQHPGRIARVAVMAGIVVLGLAIYWPTFLYPHITYDDPYYVYDNDMVSGGLTGESFRRAFTERHLGNWYPVTLLSYALEIELFGMSPGQQHATNVLLHIAAAILFLLALSRLSGNYWASAFVAALLLVHPHSVEPVVWISSRKDVLSAFFLGWMLVAWSGYVRRPAAWRLAVVTGVYALGLASKASLITVPVLLLVFDIWPLRRVPGQGNSWKKVVVEKWPLFALAGAFSVVAFTAQDAEGALGSADVYPLVDRIKNTLLAINLYLYRTVWPVDLAVFYPHRGASISTGAAVALMVLPAALTALSLVLVRRVPALCVGWCWFLVALAPMCGLIQIGSHGMADRYMYLPAAGIYLAVAWSIAAWVPTDRHRRLAGALAVAVVVVFGLASRVHVGYWKDSETLYRRALDVTTENFRCQYILANELLRSNRFEEAAVHYGEAVRIRPNYPQAHANLGIALSQSGDYEGATRSLQTAVDQKPSDPELWFNLGMLHMQHRSPGRAIAPLRHYLAMVDDDADTWFALAAAYFSEGQSDESHAALARVLALDPEHENGVKLQRRLAAAGLD